MNPLCVKALFPGNFGRVDSGPVAGAGLHKIWTVRE